MLLAPFALLAALVPALQSSPDAWLLDPAVDALLGPCGTDLEQRAGQPLVLTNRAWVEISADADGRCRATIQDVVHIRDATPLAQQVQDRLRADGWAEISNATDNGVTRFQHADGRVMTIRVGQTSGSWRMAALMLEIDGR